RLVLGPCASVGVQVNTPVTGSITAFVGALARLKVNVFDGLSGSLATLVTVKVVISSITTRFVVTINTGGRFTSCAMTTKLFVALSDGVPLSVALTVTALVPGPCASFGVQVTIPLLALIVMFVGAASNSKVRTSPASGSMARIGRFIVFPSAMV